MGAVKHVTKSHDVQGLMGNFLTSSVQRHFWHLHDIFKLQFVKSADILVTMILGLRSVVLVQRPIISLLV